MARIRFTKTVIDSLKTDRKFGEKYYDEKQPGLGIKVFPSGRKSFFVSYSINGRRHQIFIGTYGSRKIKTLEDARKVAISELSKAQEGKDPLQERQQIRRAETFEEWVEAYLVDVVSKKKNPREDRRYLKEAVRAFGDKPLTELKVRDIQVLFNRRDDRPASANRWLAAVRACLQAAWRNELIVSNPAMKIKPNSETEARIRFLNDEEFESLQKAIDEIEDIFTRTAFLLLLNTGARLSEVLKAKWSDFDFENRVWYLLSPKAGKPQTIRLTMKLVELLKNLPRLGEYVVSGKNPNKPRADLKGPWKFLKERTGLTDVCIHDLRRTFGKQISMREGILVASKLLRHSDIRVTQRHYTPLTDDELLKAMERRESDYEK